MNRYRKDDAVDVLRQGGQVYVDALVVAIAFTGEVVTEVLHGALGAYKIAVEDEMTAEVGTSPRH